MRVTVIGTGYVGLTTGAMLAEFGHMVTCVDIDKAKISQLKKAILPFYEPGLDTLVQKHLNGNLKFQTSLTSVRSAAVVMIAVGTPPAQDGSPDLSQVLAVMGGIVPYLNRYKVIIMKSTVPVGTKKVVQDFLLGQGIARNKFDIVSNPEFLREGSAIWDSFHPDRIVIGADSQRAVSITASLYQKSECPVMITSNEAAEMIKYASNAFLAAKISFVNELADICEKYAVDIREVARGVGYDKRIGSHFLNAGVGYGGSCLPKDLSGLIKLAEKAGEQPVLLKSVQKINADRPEKLIAKLTRLLGNLENKKIAVWGLAFKPDTDDMRFAPSIPLIRSLVKQKASVRAFDPAAADRARELLPPEALICPDMYDAVKEADALIIVTEWDIFKNADLEALKKLMRGPVVVDGRNIFSREEMAKRGFTYRAVGR